MGSSGIINPVVLVVGIFFGILDPAHVFVVGSDGIMDPARLFAVESSVIKSCMKFSRGSRAIIDLFLGSNTMPGFEC